MTLRLILTRHAKSSWDDPMTGDHSRPLNKRGRRSATAVGHWLATQGPLPDQALISSSERTRETWARIAKAMGAAPKPAYLDDLYHAERETMLRLLRGATGQVVMMIGHNPGTASFAQALVASPPGDSRFEWYPTAATTIIDFDVDSWADVGWRKGKVTTFVAARDIT